MADFESREREFATLERGDARLNAMRDAIHEADQCRDLHWQFWFRYDYLEESIFCGDRYYALIIFPELLSLYDNNPTLRDDSGCTHSLLICFKWIVEAAPEFPQIPKEQIDAYFREFKKRLRQQECSLSIYYMKRSLFYMHVDPDIAAMCFYRFLEEPLDEISDGKALYYDQQVLFYLTVGEEEKALKAAEPIFNGTYKSSSLPQATYHDFIRYYMTHGEHEKALHYAKLTVQRVDGDPYYHDVIGTLMTLYARYDRLRAIELLSRNWQDFLDSQNPWLRMQFASGAAFLMDHLCLEPELMSELRLPASMRKASPDEIRHSFHAVAKDLAAKFDARNGTDDYMQLYLSPFGKE